MEKFPDKSAFCAPGTKENTGLFYTGVCKRK